jgi:hypothetical protein
MARAKLKKASGDVVERNTRLTGEMMRYLIAHPQIFEALPDNFELVILPEDDPEIRLLNLDQLDRFGSQGKPVVFARLKSTAASLTTIEPNIYIPVAI